MKAIIFDSSTIINFALNGLLNLLADLKKIFPGKFIIPEPVKKEIIDRPLKNKKYELEALQIKKLFDEKIIELPYILGINQEEIEKKTKEIMDKANHTFFSQNTFIRIIDEGEASCLALSLICKEKGMENVFAVDERTARMLTENPGNLREIFKSKLHTKVEFKRENLELEKIKCIRSSELAYLAYKKNLVDLKNGNVLDALLYATKFKGNSISRQEIEEIKRIG